MASARRTPAQSPKSTMTYTSPRPQTAPPLLTPREAMLDKKQPDAFTPGKRRQLRERRAQVIGKSSVVAFSIYSLPTDRTTMVQHCVGPNVAWILPCTGG